MIGRYVHGQMASDKCNVPRRVTSKTRDPRIVQSFKRKCKVAPVYLKIAVHASGPGLL